MSVEYLDLADEAAVLIVRLAKNHPLPDGPGSRPTVIHLRFISTTNR